MERLTPLPVINAALDFSNNRVLDLKSNSDGSFELVALASGETVAVAIGLPTSLSGNTLSVEPLDGGTVSVGQDESLTVSDKGVVTFSFTPGTGPGIYRLILRNGEDDHWQLSFSFANPADADTDPAALRPQPVSTDN